MSDHSNDQIPLIAELGEKCLLALAGVLREFREDYAKKAREKERLAKTTYQAVQRAADAGQLHVPQAIAPVWLTTDEAAELIGLQPQTLRQWRHRGTVGPKSYKVGGAVRYKLIDLERWLKNRSRDPADVGFE